MKIRLAAMALLLAVLLGLLGCAGDGTTEGTGSSNLGDPPSGPDASDIPEGMIPIAIADQTEFQLLYPMDERTAIMLERCQAFADGVALLTGAEIKIAHDSTPQRECEILVGTVSRTQAYEIVSANALEEQDFVIEVRDKKIYVVGGGEVATLKALDFLLESALWKSKEGGLLAIADDYKYVYRYGAAPTAQLGQVSETYAELAVRSDPLFTAYCRLTFTGNGGWRIQTKNAAEDSFDDIGAAQRLALSLGERAPDRVEALTVTETEGVVYLTAPDGSRAEISLSPFEINFYTPSGTVAATVTNVTSFAGGSSLEGKLIEGEAIFGTGERFNSVNQRGKFIEVFSEDLYGSHVSCYLAVPMMSSSRGSGIYLNRYEYMTLDLGRRQSDRWSAVISGSVMDCYIFATEKISDVIYGYSTLTGFAGAPAEWTYGMLLCRYAPELSAKWSVDIDPREDGRNLGVYDMIAKMEAYDLPWSGILAEAHHITSSKDLRDLRELCDYVHSLGKKFLVYMIMGSVDSYMAGYSSSYLLEQKQPDGSTTTNIFWTVGTSSVGVKDASRSYLDLTNPHATEWFFEDYLDFLLNDIGVDGCKIDFCEMMPENYPFDFYDETVPTAGTHHWYPVAYTAMYWRLLCTKPDGGMCYTRGGGIGSQRAPYIWAGDQDRNTSALGMQLKATLSSGMTGIPFFSYDMAGYKFSGSIQQESAVFVRGVEYTAFTLCMQQHGTVRNAFDFADHVEYPTDENGEYLLDGDGNPIETRPYAYVTDIYRAYVKLHDILTPYITEYAEIASLTGMPVVRHMALHWQNDETVYNMDTQYMFGDAFLVAPVFYDVDQRDIYLPEGNWLDLNTGEEYHITKDTPKEERWLRDYSAGLSTLPVFYNLDTDSQEAPSLLTSICEMLAYARTLAPAVTE